MTNEKRLSEENSNLKVLLWECRAQQNLKGYKLQYEISKEKIADRERVIEELTAETKQKNIVIQELRKTIREGLCITPAEGCELIQVDGKAIGSYVSQKKYIALVGEMKEMKNKYDRLWLETYKTKEDAEDQHK